MILTALFLAACTVPVAEDPSAVPVPSPERAPVEAPEAGEFTLSFEQAHNQYAHVDAVFPTTGRDSVELMMATWTPGSYLVREYARNLEELVVMGPDGPLSVEKTRKNRWSVDTSGIDAIRVSYDLYCHEMNVRGNWVQVDWAMLNGAPTYLVPAHALDASYGVRFELPEAWPRVATALPPHPAGGEHHFVAADFDTLLDSPILLGETVVSSFEAGGKPHELVHLGQTEWWADPQVVADVQKLTQAQIDFWGVVPYDRYLYLNVISGAGGGLEHKDSTLMMTARDKNPRYPQKYRQWLGLVSHEFFHTWNVKRLRPVELGPFDYENEVHTRALWIAEGITSYYDDLLLVRTGLIDRDEYFKRLGDTIDHIERTPGRLVHPLSETSYDAWIKFYRGNENSDNTTISYYRKGAVVGWMLDAEIRRSTGNAASLDDVMRLAYERYSGERGYTIDEWRATVSEVAGSDLGPWFSHHVDQAEELDYGPALDWFGLRFKPVASAKKNKVEEEEEPSGWLGLHLGGNKVSKVLRGTPAHDFGFLVDDELLAVDDVRTTGSAWAGRMKQYPPGSTAEVLVARRGDLVRLPVTFAEEPELSFAVQVDPLAAGMALSHREGWLGPDSSGTTATDL